MNHFQILIVQKTFIDITNVGEKTAELFYQRLFEIAPEVTPLFKNNLAEQRGKFMKMLSLAVNSLNSIEILLPALKNLAVRHVGYGVKEAHYTLVGEALIWALEQSLEDNFTHEIKKAWLDTYQHIANTMIEATKNLQASS